MSVASRAPTAAPDPRSCAPTFAPASRPSCCCCVCCCCTTSWPHAAATSWPFSCRTVVAMRYCAQEVRASTLVHVCSAPCLNQGCRASPPPFTTWRTDLVAQDGVEGLHARGVGRGKGHGRRPLVLGGRRRQHGVPGDEVERGVVALQQRAQRVRLRLPCAGRCAGGELRGTASPSARATAAVDRLSHPKCAPFSHRR